ncbi:MAG: hypothetical protein IKG96_07230 [Bacteroidaceae bacterium]|nr:hypothetical protein [Bacteroidaceae bacterium]
MELLKKLFAIHSKSGKEGKMKRFIWNWVKQNVPGCRIEEDKTGNLYITKTKTSKSRKDEETTYPCIVAHLDQVQEKHSKDFICLESEDIIIGYSPKRREQQGLGADDKCGIWIALNCLKQYDNLKVAFFVGEEIGCKGSSKANIEFFSDCRFVLEPDRRGNSDLITEIGWTPLCSDEFLNDIDFKRFGYKEENGMMTDIEALKENSLAISCINLSCGYYKPHTDQEFVVKADLLNCQAFVKHIIDTCTKVYPHVEQDYRYDRYSYYGDYYDLYDEMYELISVHPEMSFGDIEAAYKESYPGINRTELENAYDLAREDVYFWQEDEKRAASRKLK